MWLELAGSIWLFGGGKLVGKVPFESLKMEIDAEIEQISNSNTLTVDQIDARILELHLYRFFQESLDQNWINSLDQRNWDEKNPPKIFRQIQKVARNLPGSEQFSYKCFRGFNTSTVEKAKMTSANCKAIREAFPKTKTYEARENAAMRETWNETVGAPDSWTPHFLKRMTRDDDSPTDISNCPLVGDYLMFRADDVEQARPAFFRFYPHEIGERIRSMGLRLDRKYLGLSSKGWVIKQQNGYMVGGYIINRSPTGTIDIDGGFSLMSVSVDQQSDLVQIVEGKVEMAPVLHMQMPYTSGASCSRGVLIRLLNAETLGGQRDESKSERLESTLEFHKGLTEKFGKRLSLLNVSKVLDAATGIDRYYFYQSSHTHDGHIPHSEAFVNSSSRGKNPAFAPLTLTKVHEKSGSVVKSKIGIDYNRPNPIFGRSPR